MHDDPRIFLKSWAVACAIVTIGIAGYVMAMDPYLLFGVPRVLGVNARKPAIDDHDRLMKAYDVVRTAPNTLLLGSSRIDLGLDAQFVAWPESTRPVYNLGFLSGSPYIAYRYLQHATYFKKPRLVVLGLDFQFFLRDQEYGVGSDFEARLAVDEAGRVNRKRIVQQTRDIEHVLSLEALLDSVQTLLANIRGRSSNIVAGNWSQDAFAGAPDFWFTLSEYDLIHEYEGKHVNQRVMPQVEQILNLCESSGLKLIVVINPMHASELEMIDLLGLWSTYEDWKRSLVALISRYSHLQGAPPIVLLDFNAYDDYSSESVPTYSRRLNWFRNTNHYTHALGDVVVSSLFQQNDVVYGVVLTPQNIESHLNEIRTQRSAYRATHENDAKRLRSLVSAVRAEMATQK